MITPFRLTSDRFVGLLDQMVQGLSGVFNKPRCYITESKLNITAKAQGLGATCGGSRNETHTHQSF
jgi:hypothetical protein